MGRGQVDDLTGERFGRLVVRSRADNRNGITYWVCECDCGSTKEVRAYHLKDGSTKSCGCLNDELCSQIAQKYKPGFKHGGKDERLYRIWKGMRNRCNNPNSKKFHRYGGRGISICDEWEDYAVFRSWALEKGYRPDLQIDRIDNDGNYEPGNCRFVTNKENSNNRSNCRFLTVNGITHTLSEWSDITGIPRARLYKRLQYGISGERVLERGRLANVKRN